MSNDENQSVKTEWSAVQVYGLSVVCLIVGICAGYLFRGSATPQPAPPAAVQQQGGSEAPAMTPGQLGGMKPTPEQMQKMADKQVAPLIEQLKSQPQNTDLMLKIASVYFATQQFPSAVKYYEQAQSVKPSPEVLVKLSSAYYYAGNTDKSVDALNRALQLDPKDADALYNLGMIKWRVKDDPKGAVACWEQLIKSNPKHPHLDQVRKMIELVKKHQNLPEGAAKNVPPM